MQKHLAGRKREFNKPIDIDYPVRPDNDKLRKPLYMNLFAIIYLILVTLVGLGLTSLLPLPKIAAVLVGPAVGIITVTTVTLVLSWFFGFTPLIIWLTIILAITASWWLSKKSAPNFDLNKLKRRGLVRNHWPLLLVFLTIGVYSTYIFLTQVLAPSASGFQTGGGGLYGDTALHSAYTMSLVEQGLPPINPLFAGKQLIYPFMVNFFSATLVKLGFALRWSFVLPQLTYLTAFITLFYLVCKRFTNNLGAFLAMLIFFLGWGLGFIPYLSQVVQTGSWAITQEFTNNMRDFHLHNVLTGLLFPERSFLPGLVIGLLIANLVLLTDKFRPKYILIILGMLLGILPLWHTHTFIFFGASLFIWLLLTNKNTQQLLSNLVYVYIPTLLVALPALLWFASTLDHERFLRFSPGWITNGDNQLLFWFKNSGLLLPLAIIGLIKMTSSRRKFFYPVILMFFIANLVIFQPWEWDNIKLFTWVFLFLSIPAGFVLARLFSRSLPIRLIGLICLISLTASGMLSLVKQSQSTFTIYDNQDIELANWIKKNTQPTDVFLIDPWPNHPVPGLTGRSVYLGYPGHLWVHGIDYGKRENQVKQILAGNTEILNQLEVPVDYVVTGKNSALNNSRLEKFYSNQKFSVIKL